MYELFQNMRYASEKSSNIKSNSVEKEPIEEPLQTFALNPKARRMVFWKILIASITIYNLFSICLRVCMYDYLTLNASYTWDILCDILFICDIVLNSTLVGFYRGHRLITSSQQIFRRYTVKYRRRFVCDLLASMPLEIFALVGCIGPLSSMQTVYLLRSNRLFRLLHLEQDTADIERSLNSDLFLSFLPKNVLALISPAYLVNGAYTNSTASKDDDTNISQSQIERRLRSSKRDSVSLLFSLFSLILLMYVYVYVYRYYINLYTNMCEYDPHK